MYNVSNDFKTAIASPTRRSKAYIHVVEDNIDITESDYLQSIKIEDFNYIENEGFVGSLIAKKCDIKIINDNTFDLSNKNIEVYIGIEKTDKTYEYVPYGKYLVERPENKETSIQTKFTAFDDMLKLNNTYETNITFPTTLFILLQDLCTSVGITLGNTSIVNGDFVVNDNVFVGGELYRDVLKGIVQLTGGFAKIGRDNKLYIKNFETIDSTPNITSNNYFSMKNNDIFGPINTVVLRDSQIEGENVTLSDEDSIAINGETELVIADNPFVYTENLRTEAITDIYNALNGFKYQGYEIEYQGFPHLDSGDKLILYDKNNLLINDVYLFNHTIEYKGSLKGKIQTTAMTKTETAYKFTSSLVSKVRKTEIMVDKANGEITSIISENVVRDNTINGNTIEIETVSSSVSELKQTTDNITFTQENTGGNNLLVNANKKAGRDYLWTYSDPYNGSTDLNSETKSGVEQVLGNGYEETTQTVSNGLITVSFNYKKVLGIGNANVKINGYNIDFEDEGDYTQISHTLNITNNTLQVKFESDSDGAFVYNDLMANEGDIPQVYGQNSNETITDTIIITGDKVEVNSNDISTKTRMSVDNGFEIEDTINNEITTKIDREGIDTNSVNSNEYRTGNLLIKDVNDSTYGKGTGFFHIEEV